jgi:hypothetical protein
MAISDEMCIEDIEVCDSNSLLSDGSCGVCPQTCEGCDKSEDKIECAECKQGYRFIELEDEIVCILCSDDNPICKRDIDTYSDTDSENDGNDATSQENGELSTDSQSIDSTMKARGEKIKTSTILATNISLGIACLCSASSLDAMNLIRYINDVKLLSYIIYLNINLPYEIKAEKETSLKNLEDTNLLSYIQISDRNLKDGLDLYIDDSYGFISRIPYHLAIFAIILLLNLFLYILRQFSKGKLQASVARVTQYFAYTAYIQLYMVAYLDVSYYSISKISHVIFIQPKETHIQNLFDYNFALLYAVIFILGTMCTFSSIPD